MALQINFILIDPSDQHEAYDQHFGGSPNWTFYKGNLADLRCYDCVVTPGNSFGDMTGGFDASVIDLFGSQLQTHVRKVIQKRFPSSEPNCKNTDWDSADQPIGTSLLITTRTTDSELPQYLCHTPTMEFARSIRGQPNVYMAMNSILFEILKHNQKCRRIKKLGDNIITSVVMPFLGTGFGELSYMESAQQMSTAYQFFKMSYPSFFG